MNTFPELRAQAETILQERQLRDDDYAQADVRHLVHELQVHQIELEMQNEELRTIQHDIETSRNQYADLYDFAPIGYVTLDPEGVILNVNVAAAAMLGQQRLHLPGQRLARFVDRDDQDTYYLYVKHLLKTLTAQTGEIRLLEHTGAPVSVRLDSSVIRDQAGHITGIRMAMSDITERKKAEEELRQLKKAVETLPIGLTMTSLDGHILYMNPAEAEMHGYQVNEMLGNDLGMFAPVEQRQPLTREQIRNMRPSVRESVNIRRDGSVFPVRLLSDVVKTLAGEPVAVVTICEDITAQKRQATEAAENMQKFLTIVETVGEGITLSNATGYFEVFNSKMEALTGYTQTEANSRAHFLSLLYPDVEAYRQALDGIHAIAHTSEDRDVETSICAKDGTRKTLLVSTSLMPYQGQPWFLSAYHDITASRQAEQKIKESTATLRALLDSSHQSLTLIDREYRIQAFNRIANADAQKLFGRAMTVGDAIDQCVFAGDRTRFDTAFARVLDGESVRLETQVRGADGVAYWFVHDYTPVRIEDGRIIGVCVSASDITARTYAENALREAKRVAEAANRAKSTFLANMSHELRTPLNGILGYAQILKWDTGLTTRQYDELTIIERSGQHLLRLINAILDLAKIEAGKVELMLANVNVRALFTDISVLFRPQAEAKGLALRLEFDAALPATIRADEQRLLQVLLNVLGNAVKFTETGGITLRVTPRPNQGTGPERVEGAQAALLTTLRFEISDTGIGIARENLTRLFEPFQQVGDDAYNAQGSGLGLAISHNLIRLMGGELQVTSVLGQGSTFWFELTVPVIAGADAPTPHSRQIVGIQGEAPKILVVEDDPVNRQMLADVFTVLGCDLREAADGESGWRVCQTFRPQAILIDLRMPNMDGLTLIRRIRRAPAFDQVVIVAMSASAYAEDRQHSLAAGSQAFLPKPLDIDLLLELLQQFLHLTWRFQEVPDATENIGPTADLILPPAAVLRALRHSAESGDMAELNARLTTVYDEDIRFAPFVNTLRQLARDFQLEAVSTILADSLSTESPPA